MDLLAIPLFDVDAKALFFLIEALSID